MPHALFRGFYYIYAINAIDSVSTIFKIRVLLVILTLGFIGTATTIHLTYSERSLLLHEGRTIERNLQKKEAKIREFLTDSTRVANLITAEDDPVYAEHIIDEFVKRHNIGVLVYASNELVFWTWDRFVPKTDAGVRPGSSLMQADNGWYLFVKEVRGTMSLLFLVPIKAEFQMNNTYLRNDFASDLIETNNLDIANYDDPDTYHVRALDGRYLFSVQLSGGQYSSFYAGLELTMWMLAGFCILVLVNMLCVWIAKRGWVWTSVLMFAVLLGLSRYIELSTGWLSTQFNMGLFDPRYFASSFFSPHLAGFAINVFVFSWFVAYVYAFRRQLDVRRFVGRPIWSAVLMVVFGAVIYGVCYGMATAFEGLVGNSDINFDLTNILGLTGYSWLGILTLWFCLASLVFIIDVLVVIARKLYPRHQRLVLIIAIGTLALLIGKMALGTFTLTLPFVCALIILRAWYPTFQGKSDFAVLISTLLLIAGISAVKHSEVRRAKTLEEQKFTIQKVVAAEDVNAEILFFDLEREIARDPLLIAYFKNPEDFDGNHLEEHLKKTYLSGYLSKYEFAAAEYDTNLHPIGNSSPRRLLDYRDKVISGAIKVADNLNFYRARGSFGSFEYFAQLPIVDEGEQYGILLIELKNRSFAQRRMSPDVLIDGRIEQQQSDALSQYAYAFYQDGNLISQFGKYRYPLTDGIYPPDRRRYVPLGNYGGFSHLMYRPNESTMVVLSKPERNYWAQIASLSFLFLVFLLLSFTAYVIQWVLLTLNSHGFSLRNLRWSWLIFKNRILYRTRIQTFMVVAVVFTLIIAGVITYLNISRQFRKQLEESALLYVADVAKGLEARGVVERGGAAGTFTDESFNVIAESMARNLNLYNTDGELILTTEPRIFDLKMMSRYMDATAYIQLAEYEQMQFGIDKQLGDLHYFTAYAPIRNEHYQALAYLSLPVYGIQKDFDENVGMLLNTLINIYALVILILGLFAVFVANKITAPLTLVQRTLAKTTIGRQNEPIFWKRNDEIGSLIREYNLMIVALEQSANKIMQAERESAWREMAKQVAHEIKNPLTPLKLGVQLLERSWREKDPNFDEKFKRFSQSFVEQIDSLSHIASEFSNFAKMPDTKLENVSIMEILATVVDVFQNNSGVNISLRSNPVDDPFVVKGDRDQLLRSFNNLIKNSIEACASKRRCRINIHVSRDNDQAVAIMVQDNGEGISPEIQKKLFQPNFTTRSSGTGLGLAFVKQAIEGMGGTVRYHTVIGRGTTFYLSIP